VGRKSEELLCLAWRSNVAPARHNGAAPWRWHQRVMALASKRRKKIEEKRNGQKMTPAGRRIGGVIWRKAHHMKTAVIKRRDINKMKKERSERKAAERKKKKKRADVCGQLK